MDLLLVLLLLSLLWRATISQNTEYGINVQNTVTVQEGLCVSIPCSFYYPQRYKNNKEVHVYWYYTNFWKSYLAATNDPQKSVHTWAKDRFLLTGDPQMDNCSLHVERAQKNDHGSYSIQVKKKNMDQDCTNTISIRVADLTQKPKVYIPKILVSGHQVNLSCTVPGACLGTRITFLWTGTALSSHRFDSQDLTSSQLLFAPQPQDHGTSLTCRVTFKNPSVTTETTAQLRIFYPPQNMKITSWVNGTGPVFPGNTSSLVVLEGESLTLICYTNSKPPATMSWTYGHQILNSTKALDPGVLGLELSKLRNEDSGEYTCQARNSLGHQNYSVRLCVQTVMQKPEVHIPEILESGHQVTLICLVPGACREGKHFTYLWTGTALSSQDSALLNTSELLFTPQSQDHGTNITCHVTFPKARVSTERTVQLRVTYPPQNLTISVSWANQTESHPPATLMWIYGNQVLKSSEALDPGILHLELSKLGPKDRGEYTCQALHPLGSQHHSLRLCVQTCACCLISEENGSWPLIFTLIRGVLMGVSFLLTYGLTWLYYTC
ncbi:sialic acid-binding Ig-like lectin 13 isoform X2 [Notamacropus eugenii]|uniref:sialic acid-binding Ig-like lectin 13 isoform X2 n=1 Tax=Notamacropus eugenii TaxID=9315 RepID=UPI003B682F1E